MWGWSATGQRETRLDADGLGRWDVLGTRMPELDGCLDVDLESSVLTNTMPVHRLDLQVGQSGPAPAAYVRALDLGVERLEQQYVHAADGDSGSYDYHAPSLDFRCRLLYDSSGLALEYPGIATRVR
ncbi:MAG: putative glycolipid-binding domain-containing protein [Aquihabitans sp.]